MLSLKSVNFFSFRFFFVSGFIKYREETYNSQVGMNFHGNVLEIQLLCKCCFDRFKGEQAGRVSKNSKYQTHKKSIKLTKKPNDRTGALKGGPFRIVYHPLLQNIKKLKGPFGETFFEKKSHNAEKLKLSVCETF